MEKSYYQSQVGVLEIVCSYDALLSLKLVDKKGGENKETFFIKRVKTQLDEYFSCKRKIFDVQINPKGTDFQKKVWAQLLKIPYGKTKSYSEIAKDVGSKNAQRAVGTACGKNPIMIIIPCHRVISKSGKLSGFAYGANVKEKLLEIEKGDFSADYLKK